MKRHHLFFLPGLMLGCSGLLVAQSNGVAWSALDAGFAVGSSGNMRLLSVAGQTFAGTAKTSDSGVMSGFLVYATLPPLTSGVRSNDQPSVPATYALSQNYPNPFNPSTTIQYALPRASSVRLVVYNILGQEVAVLTDEVRPAGYHEVVWDGKNKNGTSVSSGVYIFRIVAQELSGQGSFMDIKKMVLLK